MKQIFSHVGLPIVELKDVNGLFVERAVLLNMMKYKEVQSKIPGLKKHFSSSHMTSLQSTAEANQKWPLINLVRQILRVMRYNMVPIRKSNGYTTDGKKLYIRYFMIEKKRIKILEDITCDLSVSAV